MSVNDDKPPRAVGVADEGDRDVDLLFLIVDLDIERLRRGKRRRDNGDGGGRLPVDDSSWSQRV